MARCFISAIEYTVIIAVTVKRVGAGFVHFLSVGQAIAVAVRVARVGTKFALLLVCQAVTVTVIGAVIGMLLGGGAAFLVASATPIPASVPFVAVVAALLMAAFAGIVCGIWPAWRAARMDPVVALRYE